MAAGIHESALEISTPKCEMLSRTRIPCSFLSLYRYGPGGDKSPQRHKICRLRIPSKDSFDPYKSGSWLQSLQTIKRRDIGRSKYIFNSSGHFESLLSHLKGPPQIKGSL